MMGARCPASGQEPSSDFRDEPPKLRSRSKHRFRETAIRGCLHRSSGHDILPTIHDATLFRPACGRSDFRAGSLWLGCRFYGPPIYLQMVVQRTGWSVALVSAAVTLHFLVGTAVVANLPRLYRLSAFPRSRHRRGSYRHRRRRLVCRRPAVATISRCSLERNGLGCDGRCRGECHHHTLACPRLPAALSLAYNGASVGGSVFSPLWVMLIASSGFAQAAVIVGVSMVTTVTALSLLAFAKSPDHLEQFPDGARPDQEATAPSLAAPSAGALLWRDRRFLTLAAGTAAGLFAQSGCWPICFRSRFRSSD